MKKRIISLIIVLAMTLLTLCSCSFNYAKKDMSKYTSFNSSEFEKALLALVIADGDFGTDEDVRNTKVLDTIFAALASDAGTDNKVTDGAAGKYDMLYYGYYVTVTKDVTEKDADGKEVTNKVTYTILNSAMNPAKPGKVQFGLSSNEDVAKLVEELVGTTNIKDYVYSATTEGKTEVKDTIYISYTKSYSVPVVDADGNPELDAEGAPKYETKKVTVNYGVVTLPDTVPGLSTDENAGTDSQADGDTDTDTKPEIVKTFLEQLVGQKVGKVSDYKVKETIDGEEREVTYSGINIHWIVESAGKEIGTVEHTTYTASKTEKDVNGESVELKDAVLTYHIFPMYIVDVANELTSEIVLKKLLGTDTDKDGSVESSEKGSLEIFKSETYKNGDKTLKTLIEELTTAYNDLAKAEKALVTAEEAAKKEAEKEESTAKPAAEATEGETEKEPTAVEKAEADVKAKQEKVDELVGKVLNATDGTYALDLVLTTKYTEAVYENLENSYISTIKTNVAKEVFKLAEKYVTVNNLPKRAVKDAYARIENVHKYNFYQGNYKSSSSSSSSSATVTNYAFYNGDYNAYLKATLGLASNATVDECEAKMTAQAEDAVKEILIIYTLAEYYGEEVELTKDQKKSVKNNIYVVYLGVSEDDLLHSMQWDNIMNHILEVEENEEGNEVVFKNLKYTIDEDKTEDEGTTDDGHDHDHDH